MLTKVSVTVRLGRAPWMEGMVAVGVLEPIKLKVWNSIWWQLYDTVRQEFTNYPFGGGR